MDARPCSTSSACWPTTRSSAWLARGRAPATCWPRRERLHEFVEGLYDFWRRWDRFLVVRADAAAQPGDKRPLRAFSQTVETLARLVRDLYRDVAENVTGGRPRVYRQVAAGAEVGVYAVPQKWPAPARYRELLAGIPFVRNLLMYPPLLLDPPTNTRTGQFTEVADNPLDGLILEREQWLCYPALVGRLVVFVYFHQRFAGLGLSLANLFEVASDEEIAAGPDAVYLYGVPRPALARFGELPTVFHDDPASRLLVAAVPLEDRFGYFGYLKKMVLTLHNVAVMDRGVMPFHGAYTRLVLADGTAAGVLIIGDTATGKSETLEALRIVGDERIREVRVIADDMGSLEVAADGRVLGYGTEIGAFVRLDDLQQGYAFGQMDRAIIMSPNRVNARVVLPVTSLEDVLRGYPVDYLLYANNYEAVDDEHPVLERLPEQEAALAVFAGGAAMSKGTTTVDRTHDYLLRQPVRAGAAPGAARSAGAQDVRRRLRGRRLRRAAAHAAGAARRRERRPSRGGRSPARAHRRRRRSAGRLVPAACRAGHLNRKERDACGDAVRIQRDRLEAHQPRQGARRLRVRAQRDAHRHQRPPFGLRRHPADADPRQGRRAHADRQLLVRQDERHRPQPHRRPRAVQHRSGAPAPRRAAPSSSTEPRRCRWRPSCAATSRVRGARTTRRPAACAASRCRQGLVEASRLPEPLFTPSTKAAIGDHDENISFATTVDLIGRELAERVRDVSLELYAFGAAYALERGIIIADTKFEFGILDGELILIDEVMTPDSSRFWPADGYAPGRSQPSYDKQYVRDYLETLDWDKTAPGPELPPDVVAKTAEKYLEAWRRLTQG